MIHVALILALGGYFALLLACRTRERGIVREAAAVARWRQVHRDLVAATMRTNDAMRRFGRMLRVEIDKTRILVTLEDADAIRRDLIRYGTAFVAVDCDRNGERLPPEQVRVSR